MRSITRQLRLVGMFYIMMLLIFDFQRLLFALHNWNEMGDSSSIDFLETFVYSIPLDMATASYVIAIPALLTFLFRLGSKAVRLFIKGWFLVFFALFALIHCGEIIVYEEWHHKLSSRVFTHLSNPDEVFRTASVTMTLFYFLYFVLEMTFSVKLWSWIVKKTLEEAAEPSSHVVHRIAVLPVLIPVIFVTMRGGVTPIPININSAYFSNSHVVNDISVNPLFYFADSYIMYKNGEIDDYLPKMELSEAEKIREKLYSYDRHHDNIILKNERPNLVFVILESWSANAIGTLNDKNKGATPFFDELSKEGLLFTNIYGGSNTSEIGNMGIFGGLPALPEVAIIKQPQKYRKLPTLNKDLAKLGYSSGYMFSGDLKYGNIGGYLMDNKFQDVIDEDDFPSGLERGKLNYFDEDAYELFLKRINAAKTPFLQCVFTGSTHSPYDHPRSPRANWKGERADLMNSIVYADDCLAEFVSEAKKQPWFDNTLFVFIADHGYGVPGANGSQSNTFYRIPLLIWGEPLKNEFKGVRNDKLGNQSDLVATLLYQMKMDNSHYTWSKDLLNPKSPEFAFHTVIRGYGWMSRFGGHTRELTTGNLIENDLPKDKFDEEKKKCDAFLVSYYNFYKNL